MASVHDQDSVKEIEVMVISAQDLKNVKHLTKLRTYAVVYVEKDFHKEKTHVDEEGGANPKWNEVLKVKFHDVTAALNIDIYAHGHIREKVVGSARVMLSDVLKDQDVHETELMEEEDPTRCVTVPIWRASGKPAGYLKLWVPPTGKVTTSTDRDVKVEESGDIWGEKMEEELINCPIVMLDALHSHSAVDLSVLGTSIDRSSSM